MIEDELCGESGLNDWCIGLTVDRPTTIETEQSTEEKFDRWRIYLVSYHDNEDPKTFLEDMLSKSDYCGEGS